MFLYQVCLCFFYLTSTAPQSSYNIPCFPKYSVTISLKSLGRIGELELIRKMLYVSSQGQVTSSYII